LQSKRKSTAILPKSVVKERFSLKETFCNEIRAKKTTFSFGGFGEATYYRTYIRTKSDGTQEQWADTVIRVINGIISIRKNHYALSRLEWNEEKWQTYAQKLAVSMLDMKWLPRVEVCGSWVRNMSMSVEVRR